MKHVVKSILSSVLCACLFISIVPSSLSMAAESESLPEKGPIILSLTENASDNYYSIMDAFSQADDSHILNIKIGSAGTYPVGVSGPNALKIRSNIIFDLNGATLTRSGGMANIFQNVDFNGNRDGTGYDQTHNFTVKNGILDGQGGSDEESNFINIGHARDFSFENLVIKNCKGSHLIELTGCKNATISSCTFTGFIGEFADVGKEAVQLDISHYDPVDPWNSTYNTSDDAVCQNITIEGCTFKDYPSAIGNHHTLTGHHSSNINILNNRFENSLNTKGRAIWCFGFDNSTVKGNIITGNYGYGIYISGGSVNIENNTMEDVSYTPLYLTFCTSVNVVDGITSEVKESISAANIKDNIFTVQGAIVPLSIGASSNVQEVSGNILSTTAETALTISGKVENEGSLPASVQLIKNNDIKTTCTSSDNIGYGICCKTNAVVGTITGNTINANKDAIYVSSGASVGSIINQTKVSSTTGNGIFITAASVSTIKENTINATKGYGIRFTSNARSSLIQSNNIAALTSGIYVGSGSSVTEITSNTAKASGGTGIYLTGAKVTNIKSNTITGSTEYGIAVLSSATVGSIEANSITSKNDGIRVSRSNVSNIYNNPKITSTAANGIYSTSASKISNITWNTISSCATNGICITSTGGVGKIQYNTIKSCKQYGLLVSNKGITISLGKNSYSSNTLGNEKIGATIKKIANTGLQTPTLKSVSNAYGGVTLTWSSVKFSEGYRVFYKTAGGSWAKLADTTSTSYKHTTAKSGTKYYYTVRCITADKKSYASSYNTSGLSITYVAAPKLTLSAVNNGLKLSWSSCKGASKYRIYLKTSSGWSSIANVSGTSYTYTKVSSNKNYTFTIRCLDSSNKLVSGYNTSGFSSKYFSVPKVPTLKNTSNGVKLSWVAVTGAAKYRVFYKTSATGSWTKLGDTTATSCTHKAAVKGKTYYYTIRCISSDGKAYTSGYNTTGSKIKCSR